MNITIAQKNIALDAANEIQLRLYGDPDSGTALSKIAASHPVITDYKSFAIAIGDVILDLVPQEKLPDLLIERLQITRPEAMKVTADVLDFLAPLSNPTPAVAKPAIATGAPAVSDAALAAEIAQAEATLATVVQPMRTMAHDMETAKHPSDTTHQAASQADLLHSQTRNPEATWGDTTPTTKS